MTLFSRLVFAQDFVIQEYCFDSVSQLSDMTKRIKIVLLPSDQVRTVGTCLTVRSSEHRRELIEKYLLHLAPETRITFSSAQPTKNLCSIQLERKIEQKDSAQEADIGSDKLTLQASVKNNQQTETSQIKTIDTFEFIYEQKQFKGKCRYINANLYEITFEINQIPLPTDVVNFPAPQATSAIGAKITAQLKRGEKLEIGQIMKNSNDEKNTANSLPSLESQKNVQSKKEVLYLSIEN
jgi:hypothetical protein